MVQPSTQSLSLNQSTDNVMHYKGPSAQDRKRTIAASDICFGNNAVKV